MLGRRVLRAERARPATREDQEIKGLMEARGPLGKKVPMEIQDPRESEETKVSLVIRARLEKLALREPRETRA